MSNAIALYARETPGFADRVSHAAALLRDAALSTPAASCCPPAWAPKTWC